MKVKDLVKHCQVETFVFLNSKGLPMITLSKKLIMENIPEYQPYKDRLVKCVTIATGQTLPTLNIELKVDRKRKEAQEEAKATIGVISNTAPIMIDKTVLSIVKTEGEK